MEQSDKKQNVKSVYIMSCYHCYCIPCICNGYVPISLILFCHYFILLVSRTYYQSEYIMHKNCKNMKMNEIGFSQLFPIISLEKETKYA